MCLFRGAWVYVVPLAHWLNFLLQVLTGSPPFPECQEDSGIILRLSRHQLPSGSKPAEVLAGVDEYMCKLMNRRWNVNPKERLSCQEILEELKSKGLTREAAGEAQGSMGDHKQHFRAALGENMDMSVDLTEVATIFDEVCCFLNRRVFGG